MTSKIFNRKRQDSCAGNAMVYVLVALALFGFLTVTLSQQGDIADGEGLNDEVREFYINELIEYTSSAENTIDMMLSSGSEINDLNFVNPGSAAYDDATSPIHKVFHPQGGGLNYHQSYNQDIANGSPNTWYFQNNINIAWSPSTSNDVVMIAYNIRPEICEALNLRITGSTTIPPLTVEIDAIFNPDTHTEIALNTTNCPAGCEGYPTLCVSNPAIDTFAFYTVIAAQ